jgi:hypothetical protein
MNDECIHAKEVDEVFHIFTRKTENPLAIRQTTDVSKTS